MNRKFRKFRSSRISVVALLLAALTLFPSLSFATGNHIGPVYAQQDTTVIAFPLTTASSATQALYTGATFPSPECQISKDGGAFSDCTNTPSEIGTSGIYRLTLSPTEMTAAQVIVKIKKGSAYEDLVIDLRTAMEAASVSIINPSGDGVLLKSTSTSSAYGLTIARTSTGGGGSLHLDSSGCSSGNCWALRATSYGSASGFRVQGGTGTASGIEAISAGTSGAGLYAVGGSDQPGIQAQGAGTASGLYVVGGAGGGAGLEAYGGNSGGHGMYLHASDANGSGARVVGFGTGSGMSIVGGAGASTGVAITGNTGATILSAAANGIGLSITGTGTGTGFKAVSGTGYGMELTGGTGLYAAGSTHGIQGSPDIYPVTLGTSVWAEVSGTEPTAGPTWGATTYGQFLSLLTARFYNKVTQTASAQSVYKSDNATVMATGTVSDDGVTQTKGRLQ